jgi:hypothetical protein
MIKAASDVVRLSVVLAMLRFLVGTRGPGADIMVLLKKGAPTRQMQAMAARASAATAKDDAAPPIATTRWPFAVSNA